MRMLPPACVGETQGTADGLYLVTLVDERFFFGGVPVTLNLSDSPTWAAVLTTIGTALGITVTVDPTVPAVYERPAPDSQFWTNRQEAVTLLDAVAANLGCTFVRSLAGAYALVRHATSSSIAATNAGKFGLRTAGGDYFHPASGLPTGSLWAARNPVTPAAVNVVFPYYVAGDDPVPHVLNPRYTADRPTSMHEESLAASYTLAVPVSSGGSFVSGVTGVGQETIHVAGKAVLSSEYLLGSPSNASGVLSLAMAVAGDRYAYVGGTSLDVVAPGTLSLLMDGTHDIVWTYSARKKQATTRMVRCPWTATVDRMQHDAPYTSGLINDRVGAGGKSVAQTHTAKPYPANTALTSGVVVTSGVTPITATTRGTCNSGDMTIDLRRVDYLPTNYRWKGTVNGETILFEGTSGGATMSHSTVGIVQRAIDGSVPGTHLSGSTVTMNPTAAVYGVNLVEAGPMQFVHPGEWRSGGIQGAIRAPQTQTVHVLSASGVLLNGVTHYSGRVNGYNPAKTSGLQYPAGELVWVVERSQAGVLSGFRYGGQLLGYSAAGLGSGSFSGDIIIPPAPLYGVDERRLLSGLLSGGGGGGSGTSYPYATPTVDGIVNTSGQQFGGHKNFFAGVVSVGPTGAVASGVTPDPAGLTGLLITATSGDTSGYAAGATGTTVTMYLNTSGGSPTFANQGIRLDYYTSGLSGTANSVNMRAFTAGGTDAFHAKVSTTARGFLRFGTCGIVQNVSGGVFNTRFAVADASGIALSENPNWLLGTTDIDEYGGARINNGIVVDRGWGLSPIGVWGTDANGNTIVDGRITAFAASGGIHASPTVDFTDPNTGPTAGGTPIRVYGTGFRVGATVIIGGASATVDEVVTSRKIRVTTPANTAGAKSVTVTNVDGLSGTLGLAFTYV